MAGSAGSLKGASARQSSLRGLVRVFVRLVPKQLADEISLALAELKRKGIGVGIAAGLLAGALVFLGFLVVALIVAAILGLAEVMEPWLAALLVGALFLLIALVLGLIGMGRLRRQLPLLPEDAIRGLKYDLGVLKEGRKFDPATLEKKDEAAAPKPAKPAKPEVQKAPPVPYEELLNRSGKRRGHLLQLREDLAHELNVKTQLAKLTRAARAQAAAAGDQVKAGLAAVGSRIPEGAADELRGRWKPLTALGLSLAALVVFLRRLLK